MKKILLTVTTSFSLLLTASAVDTTKELYDSQCSKCHGTNGNGMTKMGQKLNVKDWTDAKVQAAMVETNMIKAIKMGIKDAEDKTRMKSYSEMTDADVTNLVTYIKTLIIKK